MWRRKRRRGGEDRRTKSSALSNVRHRSQAEYEQEVTQGARRKVTFGKPEGQKESRQPPENLCGKDKQVVFQPSRLLVQIPGSKSRDDEPERYVTPGAVGGSKNSQTPPPPGSSQTGNSRTPLPSAHNDTVTDRDFIANVHHPGRRAPTSRDFSPDLEDLDSSCPIVRPM